MNQSDLDLALKTISKFPEDEEVLVPDLLAEAGRKSLYVLSKYILGYREITSRTHGDIISCLEGEGRRKLLCLPRGSFKSTIGVISYSIFRIIKDPNIRILIDSELFSNSSRFLREISAHFDNEDFQTLYGNYHGSTWNSDEIIVSKRTVHHKEATITCSGIGAGKTGQHYDLIIGDDYNSKDNSNTPENRQKVIDHYKLNQSILEPTGEYVLIGTRYSSDDVIGWVIENEVNERKEEASISL